MEVSFWNSDTKDDVLSEISSLKEIVKPLKELIKDINEDLDIIGIIEEDDIKDIEKDINSFNTTLAKLQINLLLSSPYDNLDCLLEIHPGAGGVESCDFAAMLYRMYTRYAFSKDYKVEVLDYQDGEEAGIKSVTIKIKGMYAYGFLKTESGVHRLVRISPFDSNARRHTSFASVIVTPLIKEDNTINIDDKDLKIDVYRSSGKGGQGVNTTDSAVRITHLPTKIVVTCQNERSQIQNKEQALKVLKSKLMLLKLNEQEENMNNIVGEKLDTSFGSQIRSYILQPYKMIKDHKTKLDYNDTDKVLDGYLDPFIEASLKKGKKYE